MTDGLSEDLSEQKGTVVSFRPGNSPVTSGSEEQEARPPEFTDEALALRFAAKHADNLRYVAAWGSWFEWDGTRWKRDDTLRAVDWVRAICRAASAECNDAKIARTVASAKTVAAVARLAQADRRLAAKVDQWDADPWLLNTPGTAVDLRTGSSHPPRQDDHCTKATAVAPGGDCPLWLEFLAKITSGDEGLVRFLQRVAGYSLTGSTIDHALFFGYGTGANGKGVFINTLSGLMGDYATTAPMETFIATHNDRHPTELAGLRGARLVASQETEQGRRWAESKIKALTGGDKIAARFMRQDFFEFAPQFKLFITGNHKPGLRGVDEAIKRRMNLIPFAVTIPAAARDERLPEKLRGEWPGILQWAIDGCTEWQATGLAQPESVRAATDAYLDAEDGLAQWMTERCVMRSSLYTVLRELFADWSTWANETGEDAGSQKRFSQALESKGLVKKNQPGTNRAGFYGIGLLHPDNRGDGIL